MLRRKNEQKFDSNLGYGEIEDAPSKKSVHSVSSLFAVIVIISGLLMFDLVVRIEKSGPKPLMLSDEKTHPNSFIAERAQIHLKQLTSLGPRITGSYENEVLAVDYLRREINFIMQQANVKQSIELDVQRVSGSYFLDFKPYGLVNIYENVQNVVARVASEQYSNHSLLINCHFDSVPSSPGGSDDGISCVAMLETLRILSRQNKRPTHNIIFLFNGAEENPLQAAHGFITQHKWAKEVRSVINLEAAGAGGREALFQSGPGNSFLLKAYTKNAPHPYAQSVAEEIFHSNLIPSDTDFRLFRDYGHVPGLDFAFVRNGYVYHTKYDGFDNIPLGSYQHIGDNLLGLVNALGDSPDLPHAKLGTQEHYIYFDVLGLFIVSYSEEMAIVINFIVIIASFTLIMRKLVHFQGSFIEFIVYAFVSGFSQSISWVLSIVFSVALAFIIDYFNLTMSWYATPRVIFGLYFCPAIAISILCVNWFNSTDIANINLSIGSQTQLHLHVLRVLWTILLIIATIFFTRSSYIFLVPVFMNIVTFLVIDVCKLEHTRRAWLFVYTFNTILQTFFSMYLVNLLMVVFIPITGRFGSNKNPELVVAVLSMLGYVLITSFYIPLVTLLRKPLSIVIGLMITFSVTFSLVAFTSYGFPYSDDVNEPAPQRHWIFHTSRFFYDEFGNLDRQDSGYFMLNMDRNSPRIIQSYVPEIKTAISLKPDCEKYIYCGLPIFTSRMLTIHEESTWIPAPPPIIHEPVKLQLISKNNISAEVMRYTFFAKGPDHITIFISPKPYIVVAEWSFMSDIPRNNYMWNDRPTYFVMYGYGEETSGLRFWIDLKHRDGWNSPMLDIAISGKYVNHDKTRTADYQQFLNKFPSWTHKTAWIANFYSWVY